MKNVNYKILWMTAVFVLSFYFHFQAPAQNVSIGATAITPAQLLHLNNTGASNTSIRMDCQTTAGTSTDSYVTGGTANSNDNTVGTIDWTSMANVGTANDATRAQATTSTGGTTKYLKYVGSSTLFSGIGASDLINGISVTVDRRKAIVGYPCAILNAWAENEATSVAVSGGSVSTTGTSFTASAGTDRMIVVVVSTTDGTDNNITGVSWNGAALTAAGQVTRTSTDATRQEIWYLKEASITTGTSAITLTWTTASVTQDIVSVAMATYQYVDQTTTGDYRSNTSGASPTTLAPSATASVGSGDIVVGAAASGQDDNTGTANYDPPTSYNEYIDNDNATGGDMSWEVVDYAIPSGTTTQQPTFNFTSGGEDVTNGAQMVSVFVLKADQATALCPAYDNSVRLYKAGTVTGSDKADGATAWTTADVAITYGSSSDLWGTTWSVADIQNAGFGVGFSAVSTYSQPEIDYITITVTYTPAGNNTNYNVGMKQSTGIFSIANSTALGTNDRIAIDGSGNVGIGTTAPAEKLELCGNLKVVGTITAQGAITTNGAITCSSDKRFKKNILTLKNAKNNVLNLNGVSYNWKTQQFPERNFSDTKQIGFIAQEVKKIYPEFVAEDKQGFLSVDYSRLTPVLVEAVKDNQHTIDQLNAKLAAINNQLERYDDFEVRLLLLENKLNRSVFGSSYTAVK